MSCGLFIGAQCIGIADTTSAWGFPLGVTADELRASKGAPTTVRKIEAHAPLFPGLPTPKPTNDESWEYDRSGARFWVSFSNGRTQTVELSQPFTADLSTESAPSLTDGMGLKIGDTLGAILVKSGAVKEIAPNSGIQVEMAMIDVTRAGIRYHFQLTNGRIQTEWMTLLTSQ